MADSLFGLSRPGAERFRECLHPRVHPDLEVGQKEWGKFAALRQALHCLPEGLDIGPGPRAEGKISERGEMMTGLCEAAMEPGDPKLVLCNHALHRRPETVRVSQRGRLFSRLPERGRSKGVIRKSLIVREGQRFVAIPPQAHQGIADPQMLGNIFTTNATDI
jgi:hypothetical protein